MSTAGSHAAAAIMARLAQAGATPRAITADSRAVVAGSAFAAFPGLRADGRAFIGDAIARGAQAVLWDDERFAWRTEWQLPNVAVPQLRQRLGDIADFIYGSPSQELWMVGVTGTNGKTSSAHWIASSLNALGRRTALLGTLGNGFPGMLAPAGNTTPDAASLQAMLARLRSEGAQAVAMEVSSHGLDQGRVNGVAFDVALFTNLTRDHLDYHETMAAYGNAKARLFEFPGLRTAVINVDDAFGTHLAERARARGLRVIGYGRAAGDVHASAVGFGEGGMSIDVVTPAGTGSLDVAVVGDFNVMNLLGTLGVLLASDVELIDALAVMHELQAPPGRMQRFGGRGLPQVVVDYAHTPDALEKALSALRASVAVGGALWVVFGAGGDRDPGKRPEMGAVAAARADRIVVTSDNPRGEPPADIADAVARGVSDAGKHARIELDRARAIEAAIAEADLGDVVLIAGKGHEDYQEIAGERHPFSDAEAAARALARR